MTGQIIKVGVGVVALNSQGQILAAKRKSDHGNGTWSLVGGHLEFGESFEQCAARETLEETGLQLLDVEILTTANHFFEKGKKHYVTVYVIGHVDNQKPVVMEPDKIEAWQYFNRLSDIPQPHFVPYLDDLDQTWIDRKKKRLVHSA